jgi:peptide chain release factor 1
MFDKLESVERRFDELEAALSQQNIDGQEVTKLSKERASIVEIVDAYRAYKSLKKRRQDAETLMREEADADMRAMAKEELDELIGEIEKSEKELIVLTLPKDPNDDKNVILEIRAGTGGEEAALFVADMLRMYTRFADRMRWRIEMMSAAESEKGGYKEVVCSIEGHKVFSKMKFESGTHRVQRVPETEAQGRIHTSAVTVAILPEAEDVEVNINPIDLEITTCRASGAGGQHVNKTDSAIRIVHIPTGTVVECQDERSQHKNKDRAMKILKARLFERAQAEQHAKISADRKSQVGSGDRSERIRTYNFPQGRLTDHRINLTLYNLSDAMEGDITKVVDALLAHHQAELLSEQSTQSAV